MLPVCRSTDGQTVVPEPETSWRSSRRACSANAPETSRRSSRRAMRDMGVGCGRRSRAAAHPTTGCHRRSRAAVHPGPIGGRSDALGRQIAHRGRLIVGVAADGTSARGDPTSATAAAYDEWRGSRRSLQPAGSAHEDPVSWQGCEGWRSDALGRLLHGGLVVVAVGRGDWHNRQPGGSAAWQSQIYSGSVHSYLRPRHRPPFCSDRRNKI